MFDPGNRCRLNTIPGIGSDRENRDHAEGTHGFLIFQNRSLYHFLGSKRNLPDKGMQMIDEPGFPKGMLFFLILTALLFMTGCSSDHDDSDAIPESLALDIPALYSTVDTITVLVAHEPEAEPFTGTIHRDIPCWSVLKSNIEALFEGRALEPDVYVPSALSEMGEIPLQEQDTWTSEEILGLARDVWDANPSSYEAEFFVLFLKGYFEREGAPDYQIIGVSIVGTPVIAIFKDIVLSSSFIPQVARFVEQATLVHEFGHVMGLVNNGVPMVSDHLDPEHPRHCTNNRCVMYWVNEGASDMTEFVGQMIDSDSVVMFDEQCLEDTRSYIP